MRFDPDRVEMNARNAPTEDLLDRVTIYRDGMESEALEIIEAELQNRGVTHEQIFSHQAERERESIILPQGWAAQCSFCRLPAVTHAMAWHRWWGIIPLFPRLYYYCRKHQPRPTERSSTPGSG